MRSIVTCSLCALGCCAIVAAPARAQGSSSSGNGNAASRDSTRTLGAVVVTARGSRAASYAPRQSIAATKSDLPLRDTPQSVSIVGSALIADQGMQSMADVARWIPGVTMGQGEGHRDAPTIRGQATTADFFVDGVRDDAQYLRDLYNVERVEALKGSNALLFGRGGGGGVINRVTRQADWRPVHSLSLEGGSYDHKRATVDVGQGLGSRLAVRLNGMHENSGVFRDAVRLTRTGVNPTVTILAGSTLVRAGYEFFDDDRTVDRGVPSFAGRPADAPVSTYFGDPAASRSTARVHSAALFAERNLVGDGALVLRNRARWVHYDKYYQNVFPRGVDDTGTEVALGAYGNATTRANLFNQTDLAWKLGTGAVRQTLLFGVEVGRQATDNFRRTGYFDDTESSMTVPFASPTVTAPVTFRQSATDADNHVTTTVSSVYAQEELRLGSHWQAIVGARYERFDLAFHNNRNGEKLSRDDRMLSPRAGLVFKPVEPLSFYGGYSVSFLPSSGDQFSSLNASTSTLEPERFTNRELGVKWDLADDLSLTAAAYRLDRTNTSAPDPVDPTHLVQTGSQRTTGYELGLQGSVHPRWQVAGGWTAQRAVITGDTKSAAAGATVPLVPRQTLSLWNKLRATRTVSLGLGVVHQADMYAAIDNAVTLPAFTRADAALFVDLTRTLRAQVNVENVLDTRYFATSHGNNNIMPGASRTVRVGVTAGW